MLVRLWRRMDSLLVRRALWSPEHSLDFDTEALAFWFAPRWKDLAYKTGCLHLPGWVSINGNRAAESGDLKPGRSPSSSRYSSFYGPLESGELSQRLPGKFLSVGLRSA